jgi:hypothetical protein
LLRPNAGGALLNASFPVEGTIEMISEYTFGIDAV